jgi:hypothetical protein
MQLSRFKTVAIAAALVAAGFGAQAAVIVPGGAALLAPILSEDFANVEALSGWVRTNASVPAVPGTEWYQGDQNIFTSQSGAPESYAASNYGAAEAGGTISNWLITPIFSTEKAGTVTFWARADITPGYADQLAYGFSSGDSSVGSFTLGSPVTVSGDWAQYTASFGAQGAGSVARFAIVHTGLADASNYVGVDTLTVTPVPEPAAWLMLAGGLAGLALRRRAAAAR